MNSSNWLEGDAGIATPPAGTGRTYRRHWVVLVRGLAPALALVPVGAYGLLPVPVVLGLIALWAMAAWAIWGSVSLTITERNVTLESGVFQRDSQTICRDKVYAVGVRRSAWGRLFGYGTLEVAAPGAATIRFQHAVEPVRLRDRLVDE